MKRTDTINHGNTNETTPWHIWLEAVLLTAKVSVEDLEPFRVQVNRWYQAGEPVWMAADSLCIAVQERNNAIRIEEMCFKKDSIGNAVKASLRVINERGNQK